MKILSAIKDDGMDIIDAAKTFLVTEAAIKMLLKNQTMKNQESLTEVQKLKQERRELRAIIIELARQSKRRK